MARFLGLDTSNYTTSAAVYDDIEHTLCQRRRLLPVQDGALGLRQSDAVFSHTRQLAPLVEELCAQCPGPLPAAVGVSVSPRDGAESYMPCFLVGDNTARCLGAVLGVPVYGFSHQAGHIMAALASVQRVGLCSAPFLAFHVSGGTTDLLLVTPDDKKILSIAQLATSLDLKAGQAVDRVGGMLGLAFPAGRALDALSLQAPEQRFGHRPVLKEGSCCLSGIENICRTMLDRGSPAPQVALCCLDYIGRTLDAMVEWALARHPGLPVVFCGGVMSNTILRQRLGRRPGVLFGSAELSSDNACGTAVLAALAHERSAHQAP